MIVRPPRDWAAGLGDTVTLDCRASGFPPPSIQWTLGGKPLSGSGRLLVSSFLLEISRSVEQSR